MVEIQRTLHSRALFDWYAYNMKRCGILIKTRVSGGWDYSFAFIIDGVGDDGDIVKFIEIEDSIKNRGY